MRLVTVFSLVFSLLPVLASAQTSATMAGRVNDTTGAIVPGATITARHLERSVERTTVTDADGRFVLAALPVGTYDVRAELTGFKPVSRQGLTLTVGQALSVDFTLEIGGVVEAVNVVGAASPVNTPARSATPPTPRSVSSSPTPRSGARLSSIAPSTCRASGRTTPTAAARRGFPPMSCSRRRSRWPNRC